MLANRPRGITINKNAANVEANKQPLGLNNNVNNLKRSQQQQNLVTDGPIKAPTSKTPSPPKLKTHLLANFKQSENDVPLLIDLKESGENLDILQKKPLQQQQAKAFSNQLLITKDKELSSTLQAVISRIPRLRDVEEEVEDIDKSSPSSRDAIFQVCDLAKDIYSYMYELEETQSIPENFLKEQKIFTPKVRQRLVNWCVDLNRKLGLLAETMYMTISLIDRYFATVLVKQQSHVQLVALGAMLVASKYEEIYPPAIEDLIAYSENAYSRGDIMRMEIDILEKLSFDLGRPIPLAFLRRYSRAAHCDLKMHSIAKFLMEISLSEYECSHWKPSLLAAAALFTTVHLVHHQASKQSPPTSVTRATTRMSSANGLAPITNTINSFGLTRKLVSAPPTIQDRWTKTLVHYSRYSRRDLQGPAATLCKILKSVLKTPQTHPVVKSNLNHIQKWPELKSTRVDELIRLGNSLK